MSCEHREFVQMSDFLEAHWQCCDCGMSMTRAELELFGQNQRIEAKLDHIVQELDKMKKASGLFDMDAPLNLGGSRG